MNWFRTKRRLVSCLIGLVLAAQFSGMVPRLASAQPGVIATAMQTSDQYAHARHHADHGLSRDHHGSQQGNHRGDHAPALADQCCALHLLTGLVPFVVTALPIQPPGEPVLEMTRPSIARISPHRLDRPPRSSLSL